MSGSSYYRCSHCRGFYETELAACKFCNYTTVVTDADGSPRRFPDRATCRAIQIAEYEQLPAEAMADCFKPPKDELAEICGCLHCGREGPVFEAVEMRWMKNENMWACPCTTCGGRGFTFDIHPLEARWECAHCRHKWKPPGGNCKPSNCKCPKCGSTEASGMFDDEHSEEEIEAMTDDEYVEAFGKTREEEEREYREFNERFEKEQEAKRLAGEPPYGGKGYSDSEPDLFAPVADGPAEDFTKYDPEARTGEDTEDELPHDAKLPDDIDFPHQRADDPDQPPIKENDIPF
jgi:hypothetical protein